MLNRKMCVCGHVDSLRIVESAELHSEHTERCIGHGSVKGCSNAERQYGAGIARINNPIIPQASRAIVGIALLLVLLKNGWYKRGLFLCTHRFAVCRQILLAHGRQYGCCL